MRTLKMLKPGQKGTKDLLARYGPSLLVVRYRYDDNARERLKTAELFVERRSRKREAAECPPRRIRGGSQCSGSPKLDTEGVSRRRVALSIGWRERELRRQVKSGGGRWDPVRKIWLLRRDVVERLELLHRVVGGGGQI